MVLYLTLFFFVLAHYFLIKKSDFTLLLLVIVLAPPLKLSGDLYFSNHHLFVPYIIFEFLFKSKLSFNRISGIYLGIFGLLLFSSLKQVSLIKYNSIIGSFSYIVILTYLLSFHRQKFEQCLTRFFKIAVILNGLVVAWQYISPEASYNFIQEYYFTESNNTSFGTGIEWYGFLIRYTGLFFSPLLLAGFSVYSAYFFILQRKWVFFIISVVLGFFTVSKSFYACVIVLMISFIGQKLGRQKTIIFSIPLLIACFLLIGVFQSYLVSKGFSDFYEVIGRAYSSRYNLSSSDLLNYYTLKYSFESPIIGHGFSILPKVFIGDSALVDLFYQGGIIGIVTYFVLLFRTNIDYLYIVLLIILGLGINYLFSTAYIPLFLISKYILNQQIVNTNA